MRIFDDPIEIDSDKTLSMERFYSEFNDRLVIIVSQPRSLDVEVKARECISLCRAAVGAFAYQEDFRGVREVVCLFNISADIIVEAGGFKLAQEFDILTYGPRVEDKNQVQAEKARLSKEFLQKLYAEDATERTHRQKYGKAALFQGLKGLADFYHERYGWESSDITDRKGSQ